MNYSNIKLNVFFCGVNMNSLDILYCEFNFFCDSICSPHICFYFPYILPLHHLNHSTHGKRSDLQPPTECFFLSFLFV